MPSLKNAYVQRDRAREHLQQLEVLCQEVCVAEEKATVIEVKPEIDLPATHKDLYTLKKGNTPVPDRCSVLAGDTINSLRSALDYLIRNLSELDSGVIPKRTQFPVESVREDFLRKSPSLLEGLDQAHLYAIEQLQPFHGCLWTKHLASISNLHKHNDFIPVVHDVLYFARLDPIPNTESYKVNMEFTPTLYIAFEPGLPLIETLKEIESRVSQTLDEFEPEFK
jgi:hypothetical protein